MINKKVTIQIKDKFDSDVQQGLKIFAEHSSIGHFVYNPSEWEYWFKNNPYGNSIYSIAKDINKVVGFCCLIRTSAYVGGKVICGAKAEFLVVLPGYRDVTINNKDPLAFSILSLLYKNSSRYGIDLIFGIATKNATVVHKFAGAIPLKYKVKHYVTVFKSIKKGKPKIKNCLINFGTLTVSNILRAFLTPFPGKRHFTPNVSFSKSFSNLKWSKNQLLYQDKKMMGFRFENGKYLIYESLDSNNNFLVFSKPVTDGKVYLQHWSSLDLNKKVLIAVFKDLFHRCKKNGVQSVNLVIPETEDLSKVRFAKYGFIPIDDCDAIYLYISNKNLNLDLNPANWSLTDSHRGFI